MVAKQIIRSVLLVVGLGSLAVWGNRAYQKSRTIDEGGAKPVVVENPPVVAGTQVVMTYFISGHRCDSCKKIEALARGTVEKDFAAELASGRVVFRVIDTGEPAAKHYVNDYKLTSKTVVVSCRKDGRETAWVDMEKVWDLLDQPDGFRTYLAEAIRGYLSS